MKHEGTRRKGPWLLRGEGPEKDQTPEGDEMGGETTPKGRRNPGGKGGKIGLAPPTLFAVVTHKVGNLL